MSAGNRLPLDVLNEAECTINPMEYCFKAGNTYCLVYSLIRNVLNCLKSVPKTIKMEM